MLSLALIGSILSYNSDNSMHALYNYNFIVSDVCILCNAMIYRMCIMEHFIFLFVVLRKYRRLITFGGQKFHLHLNLHISFPLRQIGWVFLSSPFLFGFSPLKLINKIIVIGCFFSTLNFDS